MTTVAGQLGKLSGQGRLSMPQRVALGGMALLSGAVALVSYRYLFGAGPVPPSIAANRHFNPWIIVHAGSAATALLVGPTQFLPALRRRRPTVHRALGRLYVVGCVGGGMSGIVLASGISTGPVAGAGFASLGSVWLVTTVVAVHQILRRYVAAHERWMIRSFALTLSAVTLRLYLPASIALGLDYARAYPVIAWACWVPNALLAEWYVRRRAASASFPSLA